MEEVYLFGSRARNDARPDSDVDLALKMVGSEDEWLPEAIEFLSDWRLTLERSIGLAVDLQPILSASRVEQWITEYSVVLYRRSS